MDEIKKKFGETAVMRGSFLEKKKNQQKPS